MVARRRSGWIALGLLGLLGIGTAAVAVAWARAQAAPTPTPSRGAPTDPAAERARRDLLAPLADRLIPSADGGWVIDLPNDEPAVDTWVLAAAAAPGHPRLAEAIDAASDQADAVDRSAALALAHALALAPPGADPDGAVAAEVEAVARRRFAAGDGSWLGVLIVLSARSDAVGQRAAAALTDAAGPITCSRLIGGDELPSPGGALVVVLRVLALAGHPCPEASELAAAIEASPRWGSAVAASELVDLQSLLRGEQARQLTELVDRRTRAWIAPGGEVLPMSLLVDALRARQALGLDVELEPAVARRAQGQARLEGRLADRSVTPPTAWDVAAQVQLASVGLIDGATLRATRGATGTPPTEPAERIAWQLLATGALPSCDAAAGAAPAAAKVSFASAIAQEVVGVVDGRCRGNLDLPARLASADAHGPDQQTARLLAIVLAACASDPALVDGLDEVPAAKPGGPFADEGLQVLGRGVLADPVGACRAASDR